MRRGVGIPLIAVGYTEETGHLVYEQIDDGNAGVDEHQRIQQKSGDAFLLVDLAPDQAQDGKQGHKEQGEHQPQVEENGIRERVGYAAEVDDLHDGERQHAQQAEQYEG